jgi:hypothetical protein
MGLGGGWRDSEGRVLAPASLPPCVLEGARQTNNQCQAGTHTDAAHLIARPKHLHVPLNHVRPVCHQHLGVQDGRRAHAHRHGNVMGVDAKAPRPGGGATAPRLAPLRLQSTGRSV